jgi:hypothetical protein
MDEFQKNSMLIDAASQEVMMGNPNGRAVSELQAWFMQSGGLSSVGQMNPAGAMTPMPMGGAMAMNPMDILKTKAATVLTMAGKLGMNGLGGAGSGFNPMGTRFPIF